MPYLWMLGLLAAPPPSTVTFDMKPDAAALVEARVRGQLTGSGLEVRFDRGPCEGEGLCVRAERDAFLLQTFEARPPRRFEGGLSARAEMLAIALVSTLRARAGVGSAPAQQPPSEGVATALPVEGKVRHWALGLSGQGGQDGLGWHPRLGLELGWSRVWFLAADAWLGSSEGAPDPRLSLALFRFGGGLAAGRRWTVGRWTFSGGGRLGVWALHRQTSPVPGETGLRGTESQTTASLVLGPALSLDWAPSDSWSLMLQARADVAPQRLTLSLRSAEGRLQVDRSWPIHPVIGLGLRWRP